MNFWSMPNLQATATAHRAPMWKSCLTSGMNVVLEIDVQGALQVMKSMPRLRQRVYSAASFEELEHRLRGRGTETEDRDRSPA